MMRGAKRGTWAMLCILASGLGGAVPAAASEETGKIHAWLDRMNQSVRDRDYQGVFVYLHEAQLEAMSIVHLKEGEQEVERLVSLNGAPREVLRDHDSVTCIMPDAGKVSVDQRHARKQFPTLLPGNLEGLSRLYAFHLIGSDRVAGRRARVIAIIPRDDYRYGYRLFLDQDTALPLKTDLMDAKGRPVAQIMFTSLRLGADVDPVAAREQLQHPVSGQRRKVVQHSPRDDADPLRWKFGSLPPGFVLGASNRWTRPEDDTPVEHFVLSDGLAYLSVYIEKAGKDGLDGGSRIGAVNVWGRRLAGHQVTAVGEVPQKTVRMVVDSLEYQP